MTDPDQPSSADLRHLRQAIDLSKLCPRSDTAFSVGALVVGADGVELARGYSRETDPHDHAEEVALARLEAGDPRLATATLYSSLEPCSTRASRPRSCTRLILDTPIPRVVFAWREPALFVDCTGAEDLRAAGRTVIEVPALAPDVRAVNAHLLTRS
ncbi:MAG: dCMP deaminase [Streptosporangiales bacterium]|nr:dCMP deaminase [Streptosporangiales bacterium]